MYQNFNAKNKFTKKDKHKTTSDQFSQEDYAESVKMYFNDLALIPTLTAKEEKEIIANHVVNGVLDEYAQKRLIEGNLKFVFKVATCYRGNGVPMSELISQGNEGLVIAMNKFDYKRGFRFYCYAVNWIKAKISGYIDYCHKKNGKASVEFNPNRKSDEEDWLDEPLSVDSEDLWSDVESDTIEFGEFDSDGNEYEVEEDLNDDSTPDCAEDDRTVETKEKNFEFKRMLSILTEQEYQVVMKNYGIGEDKKSVKKISLELNITPSKVKTIKDKAMNKLRTFAGNNEVIQSMCCLMQQPQKKHKSSKKTSDISSSISMSMEDFCYSTGNSTVKSKKNKSVEYLQ